MSTYSGLEPTIQALEQRGNALLDRAETVIQNGETWSEQTGQNKTAVEALAGQVSTNAANASSAKTAAEAARDSAVAIADPESAIKAVFDIWVKDKERQAFEAATGGQCTIERTAGGRASYMFIMPKVRWEELVPTGELGSGVHEAFLVNGAEKSELLIGMYLASSQGGELVSQPRRVPRRSVNWDAARAEAQSAGFDMMSNWEWSALALSCVASGFQPRGNTDYGRSHSHRHEQGVNVEYDNTATGSGTNAWRHNGSPNGIADLVGNVWEWQWGAKMIDGRVFIAPDNDRSVVENAYIDTGWDMPNASSSTFSAMRDDDAPRDIRRALFMPNGVADADGSLWTNLEGERLPYRGGARVNGRHAGLAALSLNYGRSSANTLLGVRLSRLV